MRDMLWRLAKSNFPDQAQSFWTRQAPLDCNLCYAQLEWEQKKFITKLQQEMAKSDHWLHLKFFALGAFLSWFVMDGRTILPAEQRLKTACVAMRDLAATGTGKYVMRFTASQSPAIREALQACREYAPKSGPYPEI